MNSSDTAAPAKARPAGADHEGDAAARSASAKASWQLAALNFGLLSPVADAFVAGEDVDVDGIRLTLDWVGVPFEGLPVLLARVARPEHQSEDAWMTALLLWNGQAATMLPAAVGLDASGAAVLVLRLQGITHPATLAAAMRGALSIGHSLRSELQVPPEALRDGVDPIRETLR